jgi:hypothetical protein
MKARGVRSSQLGGPNPTTPQVYTTSQNFTPNAYPFKYKVHLISAGSSGNSGYYSSGTNVDTYAYAGGGGAGTFYVSSSTQTLSSGSLTFAIGAAPLTSVQSVGGSTTVTRNDNATIEAAWNTAFAVTGSPGGGSGGSGGAGGSRYTVSNNTGNQGFSNYILAYGGYSGGQGVGTSTGSGGTGVSNTSGAQAGNDSRIPAGGNGAGGSTTSGTVPPSYAGIVVSGTTYFAGSNYGKGADGANGGSNSPNYFGVAGAGVAILEPIP